VLNVPISFETQLQSLQVVTSIYRNPNETATIDYAMIFVTQEVEIQEIINSIYNKLEGDFVLCFCYPKGSSKKYKCDFNKDNGWQSLGALSLEGVRMVAIDEDWSALRFRKTEFIKTLTRSKYFTISADGKNRISNKNIG